MDRKVSLSSGDNETKASCRDRIAKKKSKQWEKPALEDVSGKVMAQPYIRFT